MDEDMKDLLTDLLNYFGDEWPGLHVYNGGDAYWGIVDEELASILHEIRARISEGE